MLSLSLSYIQRTASTNNELAVSLFSDPSRSPRGLCHLRILQICTCYCLWTYYFSGAGSTAPRSTKSCVGCLRRDDETRSKHLPRLYTYTCTTAQLYVQYGSTYMYTGGVGQKGARAQRFRTEHLHTQIKKGGLRKNTSTDRPTDRPTHTFRCKRLLSWS